MRTEVAPDAAAAAVVARLAARRRERGISVAEVGRRMQSSVDTVKRLECGESDPYISTLQRYARAVGVELRFEVVDEDAVAAPVMCPHCRDLFGPDDMADGDIASVVCVLCAKARGAGS